MEWKNCVKKPVKVQYREVKEKEEIETREGKLFAYPEQDYVIKGVNGEVYPIKKDIFEKTYSTEKEQQEIIGGNIHLHSGMLDKIKAEFKSPCQALFHFPTEFNINSEMSLKNLKKIANENPDKKFRLILVIE